MGQNQGAIWNDSDFVIQYCVYEGFQQCKSESKQFQISPSLQINFEGSAQLKGFKYVNRKQYNYKYEQNMIEIPPGRTSKMGLSDIKMNKAKITVKAVIGDFYKILVNKVIVKNVSDVRLKIRQDLSVKPILTQNQFKTIVQKKDQIQDSAQTQNLRKERQEMRLKYLENLLKKKEEQNNPEIKRTQNHFFFIQLSLNAQKLNLQKQATQTINTFAKISMKQKSQDKQLKLVGQTQKISNVSNPYWNKETTVKYFFQQVQQIVVQIYNQTKQKGQKLIGKAQTTLGAVLGSQFQIKTLEMNDHLNNKLESKVIIRAQNFPYDSNSVTFTIKGEDIANVDSSFDAIDKSDPYLKFLKLKTDNSWVQVSRSQVIMDDLNPCWGSIRIPLPRLLRADNLNGTFKIECWDYQDKANQHKFIGETVLKLKQMQAWNKDKKVQMQNPKIKNPGKLVFQQIKFEKLSNFVNYLQSGLEIKMEVAIDFTYSNGDPKQTSSLHYIQNVQKQPTQYQKVIKQIWQIIQKYDSDKKIGAYGFGAIPLFQNIKQKQANHCFPINDNISNPQIEGIQNLMDCYVKALKNMDLLGPTLFAPILKQAFQKAKQLQKGNSYMILLILTDGIIDDMQLTTDLIVENCNLPISIIIVGVGNSSFESMKVLDGDNNGLKSSKGKKWQRDIVQFIPFNEFKGEASLLANNILEEIPDQILEYFVIINQQIENQENRSKDILRPSAQDSQVGQKSILKALNDFIDISFKIQQQEITEKFAKQVGQAFKLIREQLMYKIYKFQ